jgi:hypothetical protein
VLLRCVGALDEQIAEGVVHIGPAIQSFNAVYEYSMISHSLVLVDSALWDRLENVVSEGSAPFVTRPFALKSGTLKYNERRVRTKGWTVVAAAMSLSRRHVAVVSATGPSGGLIPFLSAGIWGPHFVQVFRSSDGAAEGPAILLPRGVGDVPHWDPDDTMLVFCSEDRTKIAVVEVSN